MPIAIGITKHKEAAPGHAKLTQNSMVRDEHHVQVASTNAQSNNQIEE
jgi:hypothetical protein